MKLNFASPYFILFILILFVGSLFMLNQVHNEYKQKIAEYNSIQKPHNIKQNDFKKFINKIENEVYSVKYALNQMEKYDQLRTIYVFTTVDRNIISQKADLTRLRNTLRLIPKLDWVLLEDHENQSEIIQNFIKESNFPRTSYFTHKFSNNPTNKTNKSSTLLHNLALKWIGTQKDNMDKNGVAYFAESSNSYTIKLFEDIRETSLVSVWPVAFVNKSYYQKPICSRNRVVDWFCAWNCTGEKFPMDFSGFAININLIIQNINLIDDNLEINKFISSFIKLNDIEPKGNGCSEINVWNIKTRPPNIGYTPEKLKTRNLTYEKFILEQV